MTHLAWEDRLGITTLACPDHGLDLRITRTGDLILALCLECTVPIPERLGNLAWWADIDNLHTLFDWLGYLSDGTTALHILEKPYNWETEYQAAEAAQAHENATGHKVFKDPIGDAVWYCDNCPRHHGYDHEHCKHTDHCGTDVCCVCDAESPCEKEQERASVEDRDVVVPL